ncbi:MAG: hypothetical protein U0236_10330 [Nitrospira sp.]
MKVLTTADLGIDALEGVETTALEWELSSPRPHRGLSNLTEQQETFLQDRFGIKLENPHTGQWIRSWRADGA